MAEERVLYLLRNLNPNLEDFSGNFPSLNPDFLQDVAKSLSSLITAPDAKGSSRINYINFLKKICAGEEGHITVNGSNYETFIEFSKLGEIRGDLEVHNFLQEINAIDAATVKKSVLDEATEFYSRKLDLHKKRIEKLDFINSFNQKSFVDLDYTPSKKLENFADIIQVLQDFKGNESLPEVPPAPYTLIENRKSDVKVAYAVLHLQSRQKDTVICNLLNELKAKTPLMEFEIEFLLYLFKMEDGFKTKLLESFPCLLERAVIDLCMKTLDSNYSFKNDLQFSFLVQCSKLAASFRDKICTIFYELFAIANYNSSLLAPIEYIINTNGEILD